MLALIVAGILQAVSNAELNNAREAVVRASIVNSDPHFFVAHCLSLSQGTLPPAKFWEERLERMRKAESRDADEGFLARFKDLPHRFLPGSGCSKTAEWDIVERSTGHGPSLLITLGPLEVLAKDRVIIMESATSGFLTDTFTEYEVVRESTGRWRVIRQEIVLQA